MQVKIKVNGKTYPCRPTMGAMLRFKQETGREVTQIDGNSISDLCTYLWCCIVSASQADGKPFELSLMDFADNISPDDLKAWMDAMQPAEDGNEKKSR